MACPCQPLPSCLCLVRLLAVFQEKQMTCTDINTLTRQKELLLQKLSTFEETNRTLRDLLREQHCKEVSCRPRLHASHTTCRSSSSLTLSLFLCKRRIVLMCQALGRGCCLSCGSRTWWHRKNLGSQEKGNEESGRGQPLPGLVQQNGETTSSELW